jgi:hypothetical protein
LPARMEVGIVFIFGWSPWGSGWCELNLEAAGDALPREKLAS